MMRASIPEKVVKALGLTLDDHVEWKVVTNSKGETIALMRKAPK